MTTIADLQVVTLVEDPDGNTPNQYLQYVGQTWGVPADMVQPLPDRPGHWSLYGIRGYVIVDANGQPVLHPTTGARQWAMCDILDRDTRRVIRDLPGAAGWTVSEAGRSYRDNARRLIELGVSPAEVQTIVTALFNAATLEATS